MDNIKVTQGHVLTALVVTLATVVQALVTPVTYVFVLHKMQNDTTTWM